MRPVPCAGYPVPSFHACLEYGVKDEDGLWRILLWALLDADGATTLGACYEWKTGTGYGDMFTGTQTREPRPMFTGTQTRGPRHEDQSTMTQTRGPIQGDPPLETHLRGPMHERCSSLFVREQDCRRGATFASGLSAKGSTYRYPITLERS